MPLDSLQQPDESVSLSPNADHMLRYVTAHFASDDVIEVRAFHVRLPGTKFGVTVSGYFDNASALVASVLDIANYANGVFVTLNPVFPELLSRRANRLGTFARDDAATADSEISCRKAFLVDCDPSRPSGIASTDEQHVVAIERAVMIKNWGLERGWPRPTFVDSGNGAHLVYALDLPSDDGGIIRSVLRELGHRFDDDVVHVDQVVHNAARLVRLPGTINRKGDSTPERPHRLARLLEVHE
ncbi:MAG: hypothetical protein IT300_18190 [Dehalococcoidia bacterium]|nr:hypothetical protein [Dehalococcoidia bacterium]